MKKKKIALVFGTRPEAVKLAPVILALQESTFFEPIAIHTGQHKELIDLMWEVFHIPLKHQLDLMEKNQTLSSFTRNCLKAIDTLFEQEKPDAILVQGDTTSAFVGSLSGFYHKVPVGHIEAGLRSYDKHAPFPEEINRRMIGTLADWHFVPTFSAQQNLVKENIPPSEIFCVGNTVVDALLTIKKNLKTTDLGDIGFKERYVLITAHRRENFGPNIENICQALLFLAKKYPHIDFVYPVHLNPHIHTTVYNTLKGIENIKLLPPQNYTNFLKLIINSSLILTDSGGVQEEAPILGKPVLVLRDVTERPEGIDAGVAKLVGANKEKIIYETSLLIESSEYYASMSKPSFLYGEGDSSLKITDILKKKLVVEETASLYATTI